MPWVATASIPKVWLQHRAMHLDLEVMVSDHCRLPDQSLPVLPVVLQDVKASRGKIAE